VRGVDRDRRASGDRRPVVGGEGARRAGNARVEHRALGVGGEEAAERPVGVERLAPRRAEHRRDVERVHEPGERVA
jgi:hypothetical protein